MAFADYKDLLNKARDHFIEGDYKVAEDLLQQVILVNPGVPEVFQILGTIYYDNGKFNKAIRHFQRALEIDPGYTDASIGLSIILNDLGRYEEGREVFEKAQSIVGEKKPSGPDPFLKEKVGQKHLELGDLYLQLNQLDSAIEQFRLAFPILQDRPEIRERLAEAISKKGDLVGAIKELRHLVREHPHHIPGQVKLGVLLYENRRIADAIDIFERVLMRDPENKEAAKYLKNASENNSMVDLI